MSFHQNSGSIPSITPDNFRLQSPSEVWKDGDGRFHVGPPARGEIWKDGNGNTHVGPPDRSSIWQDGNGKTRVGPPDGINI